MEEIQPEGTVESLLEIVPAGARAFVARRMACPGCAMARFDTLAQAAATYGVDLEALLADLRRMAAHAGRRFPLRRTL